MTQKALNNTKKLSDYINSISKVIQVYAGTPTWVQCDLVKYNKNNGHYYLEISDTNSEGKKIASQNAVMFSSKAYVILSKFLKVTGQNIKSGMQLLLLLKPQLSDKFGLSFIVEDIDPNFTVGALEVKFNNIRQKIKEKGWESLNRNKALPFHYDNVAVLSPKNAAGLGDFKSEADLMQKHGICNFNYFTAKFEGNNVEDSITTALKEIYESGIEKYDALVFIRGGGSTSSLQTLNEFKIVAYIARFPIPVISGIGHERDKVIIDEYSRLSIDTPSKVAEYILSVNTNNINYVKNELINIENYLIQSFNNHYNNFINSYNYIQDGSKSFIKNTKDNIEHTYNQIIISLKNKIVETQKSIDYSNSIIYNQAINYINETKTRSNNDLNNIYLSATNIINNKVTEFKNLYEIIQTNSYQNTIKLGYSAIRDEKNKFVTTKKELEKLDSFKILLKDGEYKVNLKNKEKSNESTK
tara:strand:+ start:36923 stop:38332 length:1410 start_codon:yes stop_codon:yes gene_type:complete